MPTIAEGALTEDAERRLLARLTDVLLEHEGADPTNPVARSVAWVFLHRPAAAGRINRLADIVELVVGDRAAAERYAARRLRRDQAPAPA